MGISMWGANCASIALEVEGDDDGAGRGEILGQETSAGRKSVIGIGDFWVGF